MNKYRDAEASAHPEVNEDQDSDASDHTEVSENTDSESSDNNGVAVEGYRDGRNKQKTP